MSMIGKGIAVSMWRERKVPIVLGIPQPGLVSREEFGSAEEIMVAHAPGGPLWSLFVIDDRSRLRSQIVRGDPTARLLAQFPHRPVVVLVNTYPEDR
jgi:hypothetical protein